MVPLRDEHVKIRLTHRTTRSRLAALLLACFTMLLMGTAWHSTAKPRSMPVRAYPPRAQDLAAVEPAASRTPWLVWSETQALLTSTSTFSPFLHIVPGQDGTELYISAGNVGELGGTVFANIGIGPGHDRGGYTMTYSDTDQSYVVTVAGFTSQVDDYGPLWITTTLGLATEEVDFYRAYVQASTSEADGIWSLDGGLQLSWLSTDTITHETYIAIVRSYAPPSPAPLGHRLVGSAYSVRAAGALVETNKPMFLRLYYDETTLAGANPHSLAIFAWHDEYKRWDKLGGTVCSGDPCVWVNTSRFTTYALMTTPLIYLPLVVKQ
jgi:hypothetical protein